MPNAPLYPKTAYSRFTRQPITRLIAAGLTGALLLQLAGCGTLLYPERKGKSGGRIDPAVAILDGIGLLFWVIPGLVAYAIDFANGTIYLPSGKYAITPEELKPAIKANGEIDTVTLEQIIHARTGHSIPFNHPNLIQQQGSPEMLALLKVSPQA
ncbi:polyribonucleotide nucleotidyltransferase [Thiopseudomonas alkaliphila]|uniref:polyribonucleotide nucleotidyltransferase n=1 Tax=Thiopseudomonas alkaliphila TaxID=1697053 RepID=UPI0025791DFE|nr:polyribonucleotide nucleotidyltransferase [Thiopseudomonas alkaliphila]MDM1717424.1 polyribonucleotide nucleotidyltransferase [Thiopseudomonas alkaliphila]